LYLPCGNINAWYERRAFFLRVLLNADVMFKLMTYCSYHRFTRGNIRWRNLHLGNSIFSRQIAIYGFSKVIVLNVFTSIYPTIVTSWSNFAFL
jgi:hypothetical protein